MCCGIFQPILGDDSPVFFVIYARIYFRNSLQLLALSILIIPSLRPTFFLSMGYHFARSNPVENVWKDQSFDTPFSNDKGSSTLLFEGHEKILHFLSPSKFHLYSCHWLRWRSHLSKCQSDLKQNGTQKRHHFLAQFSMPFHMMWSVLLRVLARKNTIWLVEILWAANQKLLFIGFWS